MFKTIISKQRSLPEQGLLSFWMTLGILVSGIASAQPGIVLTLDSCIVRAERNYPQIAQYELLDQAASYAVSNISKEKFPKVTLAGQASYQSAVTSLPGGAPGSPVLSKDQYKLYGEIVQPLTDLTVINQRKKMTQVNSEINKLDLEVQLYPIRERVSELYFGILLLDNQTRQVQLAIGNLDAGLDQLKAAVAFGTALRSNVNILLAERLVLEQRITELTNAREAYLIMLGLFVGQELNNQTQLASPVVELIPDAINRPELALFEAKIRYHELATELTDKNNLPKFSLFLQSGFGRPALNFLSNDFEPYYIGGLRLSWRLSNYYTASGQKQLSTINQHLVNSTKETFLFNTNMVLKRQTTEIRKMEELIAQDIELIQLRDEIMKTAQEQLVHGVITAHDFKSVVLAADAARQGKVIHEIELQKTKYAYNLTSGN